MDCDNRVVSSPAEELILVDADDNETGYLSKAACHDGDGVLHRAFSLFVFNEKGQLLLQRRASNKRLWGGYWSNSVCSHPRRGESTEDAARRRLRDELNVDANLEYVYKFCYQANFGDAGAENELCHVYLGSLKGPARPNKNEIDRIRYLTVDLVEHELRTRPEVLTPWFKLEWQTLNNDYADELARYTDL